MKKQTKAPSKALTAALGVLTVILMVIVMNSVSGVSKGMLPVPPVRTPVPTSVPTAEPTPVPTFTPAPTHREYVTLSRRLATDKNGDVALLQARLKELGYYTGEADGYYSDNTFYAVLAFQRMNGLSKDGIAGPGTQQVLFEKEDVLDAAGRVFVPFMLRTPTPTPTAAPTPAVLPMDDFSAGRPLDEAKKSGAAYADSSVSAKVTNETLEDGTVLTARVSLSHPSQLRGALAGTVRVSASMDFALLSEQNNAVIAVPAASYRTRKTAAVLNGRILRSGTDGESALAVFTAEGDLRLYAPANAGKADLSEAYQALSVPGILVISGMTQSGLGETIEPALLAVGQTEGLDYLVVRSEHVSESALAAYLKEKGCENAFLAGKGADAVLYSGFSAVEGFAGRNALSVDSILYFASVSEDPI